MKYQLIQFYKDAVDNFISYSALANHYGLTTDQVIELLPIAQRVYMLEYDLC